jgi:hypothetical protein
MSELNGWTNNGRGEPKYLDENPFPHGPAWDQSQGSAIRAWQLSSWVMVQPQNNIKTDLKEKGCEDTDWNIRVKNRFLWITWLNSEFQTRYWISQPAKDCQCLKHRNVHTCHALSLQDGSVLWMRPSVHSKQGQVLIQIACTSHTCDRADMWGTAVHLSQNGCHPRGRDND